MELLSKKADDLSPFKHGIFQVDSRELMENIHSIKFELQPDNEHIKLRVKSHLLEEDNFELLLKGPVLIIFISEKIEIGKPLYVHHVKRNLFEQNGFERLRSCRYILPSGDYKIERTIWNKNKNRLEISLCKNDNSSVFNNRYKIIRREQR